MALLKVVLNNCVFSFQGKFYKQIHGAAMVSPCSPVVANIYVMQLRSGEDPELCNTLKNASY